MKWKTKNSRQRIQDFSSEKDSMKYQKACLMSSEIKPMNKWSAFLKRVKLYLKRTK